jgi:hypothetical protein
MAANVQTIKTQEELFEALLENAEESEALYEKSLELGIKNTQEFINWQDRLNKVSLLPPDD